MASQSNLGADMLENVKEQTPGVDLELAKAGLQPLTHKALLGSIQKINGHMTRELLNSPDTLRVIDLDDAPVPINPRTLCALMAPYLCMN